MQTNSLQDCKLAFEYIYANIHMLQNVTSQNDFLVVKKQT